RDRFTDHPRQVAQHAGGVFALEGDFALKTQVVTDEYRRANTDTVGKRLVVAGSQTKYAAIVCGHKARHRQGQKAKQPLTVFGQREPFLSDSDPLDRELFFDATDE